MNMTYTNSYTFQRSCSSRRALFWNRVADVVLSAACVVGIMAALFFLLTM